LVSNLSGGNRQKVCLAKGLAINPDILIIDEPTVGIDVNTKAEIHELIWRLSQDGVSIIVITSDLPELIQLVDRIIVFRDGEIVGDMENDQDYEVQSNLVMNLILQETKKEEIKN
jgi:ribose transport system ATP-binding protein